MKNENPPPLSRKRGIFYFRHREGNPALDDHPETKEHSMSQHPLRTLIETCDAAISRRDFDALMAFYAEDAALVVKPGMVARGIPAIRRAWPTTSRQV